MAKDLVFKLVISEAGKDTYTAKLSYEAVSNIVSNYSDNKESNDFFALAAQHAASTVRENVAYKDNLSADVVNVLSQDSSIAVLRNLARSSAFKENATQDLLDRLIKLDTEIAQTIASNVESFEQADVNKLAALLATHSDPSVVASLAQNYSTPKKVLKTLVNHPDPFVASEAKARLED
jgi:hypothetical protein